jgi:MFS family permease
MEGRRRLTVLADLASAGLGTAGLRRLQIAWGAAALGNWAFFVALAIYAYDVGGAAAVGAAALVRMLPAGLAAPVAGVLADRHSRRTVLTASLAARAALAAGLTAAIAGGAPFSAALALAALITMAGAAHKPAQAALVPQLAATPRQLGAANALLTGVDNAAFLGGSLVAGAIVATASVETASGAVALLYALATLAALAIPRDPVPEYRVRPAEAGTLASAVAGFRDVAAHRDARLVVGFLTTATLVEGAVDVLVVVMALELLDMGDAGVGWLNAAWGLGGLVGGGAALALLGRGRLATGLAAGGLLVGVSLAAAGLASAPGVALALLVALGIGYALVEVAGCSLLQRLTSDEVLGRAFAVVESTYWVATGLGAALAPVVVGLLGERGAILAVGACLPLVVLLRRRALLRFEEHAAVPEREFGVLRGTSVFAPLPPATVENLARRVAPRPVRAGQVVVRRGEPGDEFFVIADGVLDVSECSGAPAALGAGDFFGEIALLRGVARTATVTARGEALLYVLDREAFLGGVGAHPRSFEAAERVAAVRLEPG